MSHLIDTYSRAIGLEIRKPFLQEKFFPLAEEKYITIQGGSAQPSKCYDFFSEVVDILAQFLSANKISILQLGGKEDVPIKGCKHLMGATSLKQVAHIIRGSLLHIGNDSWMTHLAGMSGIRLVAVYGSTSIQNHGPYWKDPNQTILIESHRNGCIPTYSQEPRKTVNLVQPEEIASAVGKLFGVDFGLTGKTVFLSPLYNTVIAEYVPNFMLDVNLFKDQAITIRMDYNHDENLLLTNLRLGRKLNVVCNRPISIQLLSGFRQQIVAMSYEASLSDDPSYFRQLKRLGLPIKFFSRVQDAEKISELRLKFFDITPIEYFGVPTREDFFKSAEQYLNYPLDPAIKTDTMIYRSNKYILSNGKIYPSKAAMVADRPIPNFEANTAPVLDTPEMWEEFNHFRFLSP